MQKMLMRLKMGQTSKDVERIASITDPIKRCYAILHGGRNFDKIGHLQALVAAGFDLNSPLTPSGQTALHVASFNRDGGTIKYLLDNNANVNQLDQV